MNRPVDNEEIVDSPQRELNVKKYLIKLLRRWPIILAFFVAAVLMGYGINRYATPVYSVTARITTKKFSDKASSPIPGLVDANFFLSGLSEVYEEIPLLKSPKRIEAALDKLDYRVSYFAASFIKKDPESINGYGFDVEIDSISGPNYPYGQPIFVSHTSEREFFLSIEEEPWHSLVRKKAYRFDQPFNLGDAVIHIRNTNGKYIDPEKYYFVLNRKAELISEYSRKLNIDWAMRGSAMLDLRINSESPEKDIKFMKAYYEVVEQMGLEEKNETLDNTIRFIDEQMKTVTDSLVYYQRLIDNLKLGNRKLTLGGPEYVYGSLNELDKKEAEIILHEKYFDYLTDYFRTKSKEEVFAPSLLGLNIPLLEGWVNEFINAKLADRRYFTTENSRNPLVNKEDSLRKRLEKGIFEAIKSAREMDQKSLSELRLQSRKLYGSVGDIQNDSRELSKYERMLQLNQTLFDLFLRRKTEAAISKASATSDYKIIDAPGYSRVPIEPDAKQNLLIAAAIGLILPIGFFLAKDIANTKVMDQDDLVAHTQIPLLGNVAHSKYPSNLVVRDHPRSVVAESFRAVRANLKFLSDQTDKKSRTFLITSSIGGEGKTFCSINLAYTLSLSQKRTVIIGADLRKPTLSAYMDSTGLKGLSEYLAGLAEISDIITPTDSPCLSFIPGGAVAPNPSELLSSSRMEKLILYLKEHYDFIVIDTSPIGLVSDAMELFRYADYNLLIVRQKVTHKQALAMINNLYIEGKVKNFAAVFNDIDIGGNGRKGYGGYGGYGYIYGLGYGGYGYGYYDEDKQPKKKKNSKTWI